MRIVPPLLNAIRLYAFGSNEYTKSGKTKYSVVYSLFLLVNGMLSAQPINYSIEIVQKNDADPKIAVDLTFYHAENDSIFIPIPTAINHADKLYRNYRNLTVTGGRIVRRDTNMIILKRTEKKLPTMTLHYEIFQSTPGNVVTRTTGSAPIIQPDYIHLRGYSLLLAPLHYRTYDVTVDWKNLPKNWTIQNSFSAGELRQHFLYNERDAWRRTNWVAGDFRQYKGTVMGKPVWFAIRGEWIFEDTTLFNVILHTVETQRKQWSDTEGNFYSVTLIPYVMPNKPVERDAQSLSLGYGLTKSFVTYADPDCLLDNFIDLFNHEMMHEWIGGKIDQGNGTDEINMRWFAEGFTEYYALRNRWKAGFLKDTEFFDELNKEYFANHYQSEYAEIPNLEAEQRRWETFDLERLAYRRGCIAAFYLDCAIRKQFGNRKTLFNFMNDLMEFTYGTGRDLSTGYDYFTETLDEYLPGGSEAWLDKHIGQGKKIAPAEFQLPDFLQMKISTGGVPQFSLPVGNPNAKSLFQKD